jgi:hypothetical protein
MKKAITFDLKGADKVFQNLKNYPKKVQLAVQHSILDDMVEIATEQVNIVPVDTGRLKGSIEGPELISPGVFEIKTNVEYAPFIEFGTSRMAAQPFFFPPYLKRMKQIVLNAKMAIDRTK